MTTPKQRLGITVAAAAILAIGLVAAKSNAKRTSDARKEPSSKDPEAKTTRVH
jgi:hypothetical protein